MKNFLLTFFTMMLLCSTVGWGQTTLSAGDIMIVTVNADGDDNFDFVPLVDLEAGTVIYFTDKGWDSSTSSLVGSEGTILYTASGTVSKGTVISFSGTAEGEWSKSGSFNIAGTGDNILVYQESSSSPSFIYGIGWANSIPWVYTGTNDSDIPSVLSADANTIVTLGTDDNYQYDITAGTNGTQNELLALIANSDNWDGDNSTAYSALSATFTVNSGTTPTISVTPASLSSFSYFVGYGPSTAQSVTVSGTNLTSDITVSPSANYEISTDGSSFQSSNITLTQSEGTVDATTIYIRLIAGLSADPYSETITLSSSDAEDKTVSCSGTVEAVPTLIISEIADPSDNYQCRFVEIYNYGTASVDLTSDNIYLSVQQNSSTTISWNNIELTGTIAAGATYVIAKNEDNFTSTFGNAADQYSGYVNGDGNDGYYLYFNGDYSSGVLLDAYGVIDENGTDTDWEYTDSKATRKSSVTAPNTTWTASEWDIHEAIALLTTPGSHPTDESWWNGSSSTDWATASNWDNGVPTSGVRAVIPSSDITDFPEAEAADEAQVEDLILLHDAQLNGQENVTVSGTVTVEHEITESTSSSSLDHWQYFTSPFTSLTAGDMLSSNARVDLYMIQYDNSLSSDIDDAWKFIESTTDAVLAGTGYAVTFVDDGDESGIAVSTDYTMSISGTLVDASSDLSVTFQYSGSEETDNNWNLIGNPYLAPIDWFDDTDLDYSNIQGNAAYIYDPSAESYITIVSEGSGSGTVSPSGSSELIPPIQGFFVNAAQSGSFTISAAARVDNEAAFYKSSSAKSLIRIQVKKDSLFDETVVAYNEDASPAFDRYDANKLLADSKTPQIYTTADNQKLVFNYTNTLENDISLSVRTEQAGDYTIILSEILGDFNDYIITLNNQSDAVNLNNNQYTFTAGENENTYQVTLSFQTVTSVSNFSLNNTKVYAWNKEIRIKSATALNAQVNVFNLSGLELYHSTIKGTEATINLHESGIVLVQLISENQILNYKININ